MQGPGESRTRTSKIKILEDDWPENIFPYSSPSALPTAETPFYIDALSVSARGHAQCVCSHESPVSSSYERKHRSVCASCIVPGCCAQVALCKLLHASGSTSVFKLFCARCSVQVSLRKTLGACICAQDAQPELSCGGAPSTRSLRFRVAIFWSEPPGVHSTYYGFFA